jgi:hypothetical protein
MKCTVTIIRFTSETKSFKRTYERWGLKDGEGKLRIETSEGK